MNDSAPGLLSITNSQSPPKPMSIDSVMPSNPLILCRPLLLLPAIPHIIRVFSNESTLHIRCPKYWSFSFSISASNEHPGPITFRVDWLDLLAVQGTLKSLLQHHSSKASILQHSAFFMVQLSHPYMTTGKTIALTRRTFIGKVMSLLFNMLSRLVITFIPRSKRLLISWLQSPSAVILEPRKIVSHCFRCFPIYLPWSDGTGCHDLSFLNVISSCYCSHPPLFWIIYNWFTIFIEWLTSPSKISIATQVDISEFKYQLKIYVPRAVYIIYLLLWTKRYYLGYIIWCRWHIKIIACMIMDYWGTESHVFWVILWSIINNNLYASGFNSMAMK